MPLGYPCSSCLIRSGNNRHHRRDIGGTEDNLSSATASLSRILCVRHTMKPERRRYAEQQEDESGASS